MKTVADLRIDATAAVASQIWADVNAEGGTVAPGDPYAAGYCAAIERALVIIERHGGSDPALLRIALQQQEAA